MNAFTIRHGLVPIALTLVAAGACSPEHPRRVRPAAVAMGWNESAVGFRTQIGRTLFVHCSPTQSIAPIWGTDVYTIDSSICTAALHAGRVSMASGGDIAIEIRPAADGYVGTLRNGVASESQSSAPASFGLVDGPAPGLVASPIAPAPPPPPPHDPWTDNAVAHRGQNGESFVQQCPPGSPRTIWGTDVYTDDSSICSAAAHAGRITTQVGGRVTLYMLPGRDLYFGTARHGVTSSDYGSFAGSFAFEATPSTPTFSGPPGVRVVNSAFSGGSIGAEHGPARVYCPPDLATRTIWGTGEYTGDSSVCTAAVHAGRIEAARGGVVSVRAAPGHETYRGSTAHGVTSLEYGRFATSFTLAP